MLNRWARDKAFKTVGWSFPQISPLSKQKDCTSNSSLSGICIWLFMSVIPAIWNVLPYFNCMFKVYNKTKQNKTKIKYVVQTGCPQTGHQVQRPYPNTVHLWNALHVSSYQSFLVAGGSKQLTKNIIILTLLPLPLPIIHILFCKKKRNVTAVWVFGPVTPQQVCK